MIGPGIGQLDTGAGYEVLGHLLELAAHRAARHHVTEAVGILERRAHPVPRLLQHLDAPDARIRLRR